jgi:DNA polymerase-3 subunit gamma/tau
MVDSDSVPYRVLARKYRPQSFSALIGQDALVRTLTNAIATGRLAHAYLLTGVRGVGKTTSARIVARALNCIGPDGTGGATPEPCGICEPCQAIAADRHPDVIEMDAASRTGVDDIREIIEGVRYRPVQARYKIYIIDEVHMLSRHAFNALLKTLEEPPEHTKFLFATTDVHKLPVTVLSRCQRFDLRRVETAELAAYLQDIARREAVALEPGAAALLARAADGSVRDGLSMLDQAIALAQGPIAEILVRDMLGLADRALVYDLFEAVMSGDTKAALGVYDGMHSAGAQPLIVAQDLLELVHGLTRLKVAPDAGDRVAASEPERVRGAGLADRLSVPVLTRAWQILLKGIAELQQAPDGRAALEMVLIRLGFVADLPTPGELVRHIASADGTPAAGSRAAREPVGAGGPRLARMPESGGGGGAARALAPQPAPAQPDPRSFEEAVALFKERGEPLLHSQLTLNARLVQFEPGRLEIRPTEQAPADLAARVAKRLSEWTGRRWVVSIAGSGGAQTLREQADEEARSVRAELAQHPLVRAVLDAFPGAEIEAVRNARAEPPATGENAADEIAEDESLGEESLF